MHDPEQFHRTCWYDHSVETLSRSAVRHMRRWVLHDCVPTFVDCIAPLGRGVLSLDFRKTQSTTG